MFSECTVKSNLDFVLIDLFYPALLLVFCGHREKGREKIQLECFPFHVPHTVLHWINNLGC